MRNSQCSVGAYRVVGETDVGQQSEWYARGEAQPGKEIREGSLEKGTHEVWIS